ncbi:SET domain-containing protein [Piscinibacter gummiphilus]|uniref:SET domain-containing protein n=1 Tax=Piscinibacter gummiphilus TaxID=946333 RepID=A0ABZ0CS23_9BURK|nr:SET domain-containing protein [Piscinibacter gummiphilus]WOB07788.1 SET domain-containing protein [Piscinibacter gummiphilus]
MPRITVLTPAAAEAPPAPPSVQRPRGVPADPQKFKLTVGPSVIDGQGVFAAEPIPARRKIGEVRGEPVSQQEAAARSRGQMRIMMIAVSARRAIDASQSTDALRFINHSCRPNTALKVNQGRVEFYALRNIAPGDELTVNYGETHHRGRLSCRCGVAGCAGVL